ncbi:MAG: hypothetical protein LBL36_03930, partial [Clostridiales Family XIII bacterium]|jgi:1,4-dihydroxy-2-naphthoate octaprenyltransferase|nr:hypothetical protein [Clostridiales Family XIII bacterium]
MTNNICDIERDSASGRRTLPVLLGRRRARSVYGVLALLWYLPIFGLTGIFAASFQAGERYSVSFNGAQFVMMLEIVFLIECLVTVIRLLLLPLTPETRARGMKSITRANVILGFVYTFDVVAAMGLYGG